MKIIKRRIYNECKLRLLKWVSKIWNIGWYLFCIKLTSFVWIRSRIAYYNSQYDIYKSVCLNLNKQNYLPELISKQQVTQFFWLLGTPEPGICGNFIKTSDTLLWEGFGRKTLPYSTKECNSGELVIKFLNKKNLKSPFTTQTTHRKSTNTHKLGIIFVSTYYRNRNVAPSKRNGIIPY